MGNNAAKRTYGPQAGITLIDTVVGTALMLVVFLGIAAAFQLTVDVVTNSKARAGAIALGNERMEYLKSLSYAQIGVVGGIPSGTVPQLETMQLNGVNYTRRTIVYYSDDPTDGTGAADTNSITADYKTIRVEVSWYVKTVQRSVELVGRVSPQGVETAVPGGTLTIRVVDSGNAALEDAQIDITNNSTTPAISIRTFSNDTGSITFIGAPASAGYHIVVTKPGYSSDQTYPITAQNTNPNPRDLTVSNNQTTSYTFSIDRLSSKTIQTFKALETRTWNDGFSTDTNVSTTSSVVISGGVARLDGAPYPSSGFVMSTDITSPLLSSWKTIIWTGATSSQTAVRYSLYSMQGGTPTLIPDGVLPGNSAGFTATSTDISAVSTTTYPVLRIGATLSTSNSGSTPSIDSWGIQYVYGPEVLPNLTLTLRGLKTIGNSPTIYKYNQTLTSNASGIVSLPSMEWDAYTLDIATSTAYEAAEICATQPEMLSPGVSQTTRIYAATNTPKSLIVDVKDNAGTYIAGANVRVFASTTNKTLQSSACGQAYFPSLNGGYFTINTTKAGFQMGSSSVFVNGDTRASVTLQP